MKFGKIDKFVLIGGEFELYHFAKIISQKKIKLDIIIGPRHAKEIIKENKSLEDLIKNFGTVYKKEKLDENFLKRYISENNTLFVSFGSPWIFKKDVVKKYFKNRLVNSHSTRLPQNRGGGGFSWRILTQNKLGYCAVHRIDSSTIDAGEILLIEEFIYPFNLIKPIEYEEYQNEKEKNFLENFLEMIIKNRTFSTISQPEYLSSYFPRLTTSENSWIDWNYQINDLFNFICAFDDPYEGARTMHNKKLIKIKNVNYTRSDQSFHPYQYGLVFRKNNSFLLVACNDGTLIVDHVTDKSNKNYFDQIKVGDRLHTPIKYLDNSKNRYYYDATKKYKKN